MLDSSLCQQVSSTRLWTFVSRALLFVLSQPLMVAAILVALASLPWVLKRDRDKKRSLGLGILLLAVYLLTISPLASQLGTHWLVSFLPADVGAQADAIVVLGRGEQQNPIRADIAGQLWQAKRAPLIFPSGRKDAPLIAELIEQRVPDAVVEGEPCSLTTEQNAEFTAALLRPKGVKTIILVTDPPHMGRSLLTFESFGFKVIPYFSPLSADTSPAKKRFIVTREIIGFLQYKMMGRYVTREVPPPSIINQEG